MTSNRVFQFLKEKFPKVSSVTVDTLNFGVVTLTRDEAIAYAMASIDVDENVTFVDDGGDQICVEFNKGIITVMRREVEVDGRYTEFEVARMNL
jgi:hypothetical protein